MSVKLNTKRGSLPNEKKRLRAHFKKVRKDLLEIRRSEAREAAWDYLQTVLETFTKILSFASMKDEVDLSLVNKNLALEGKLHLPKIEDDHLVGYSVKDMEKETYIMKHGIVQPSPDLCRREETFDCILVPAIAFDETYNRLGYGFGYYDRLLQNYKGAHTIGIAFREQLSPTPLPTEHHDQPVKELCLV